MAEGRRDERKTIYKPVHDARSRHSQVLGRTHRQTAGCSAGQTDTDTHKVDPQLLPSAVPPEMATPTIRARRERASCAVVHNRLQPPGDSPS